MHYVRISTRSKYEEEKIFRNKNILDNCEIIRTKASTNVDKSNRVVKFE